MYPSDLEEAYIKKIINGTTVLVGTLTKSSFRYNLYFWHTVRIDFSPQRLTGYFDGKEILRIDDPQERLISAGTISLRFYQQDGYLDNIYAAEGERYSLISDVGNLVTWTDTGLSQGCYYAITAYDKAKNESIFSEPASATTFSGPHITLTKTCDKKYTSHGDTLTYTITYTNEGLGTATDVVIIEVLPENCKMQNVKCKMQNIEIRYWCNEGWQTDFSELATKIKWLIPQVAPGESGSVSITMEAE